MSDMLIMAAGMGAEKEVQEILNQKRGRGGLGLALLVNRQEGGTTALIEAADSGSVSIVEMLIQAGADVDGENMAGQTAFDRAVARGNMEIVRCLLERGADPEHPLHANGGTPVVSRRSSDEEGDEVVDMFQQTARETTPTETAQPRRRKVDGAPSGPSLGRSMDYKLTPWAVRTAEPSSSPARRKTGCAMYTGLVVLVFTLLVWWDWK